MGMGDFPLKLDGWYYHNDLTLWWSLITFSPNPGMEWTSWPKSSWLAGPFLPPPNHHWRRPQDKHDFTKSYHLLIQDKRAWRSDSLPLCWRRRHDAWGASGQPIWGSTSKPIYEVALAAYRMHDMGHIIWYDMGWNSDLDSNKERKLPWQFFRRAQDDLFFSNKLVEAIAIFNLKVSITDILTDRGRCYCI